MTAKIIAVHETEEHAEAVAEFFRQTWDPNATTQSVIDAMRSEARRNVAVPGQPVPTALVLQGDRVIGYCSSIPQRIWDGSAERSAYWVKGLMVLPEFRNGPVGFLVMKELVKHLPCSTILTVAPAARRLFGAMGYTDLGAVANWIRPLRPGVIASRLSPQKLGLDKKLPRWALAAVDVTQKTGLARLGGGVAGVALAAGAAVARMPGARFDTSEATDAPERDLDELWQTARGGIRSSPVRNAEYLAPRFSEDPGGGVNPYTYLLARERGRLQGMAVIRRPKETSDPRLAGLRLATISDFVFPPDRLDAALATLGAVERHARAARADAITCMTSYGVVARALRRQGYVKIAGNVHFFVRDLTGQAQWATELSGWWLNRGDGESDATF